MRRKWVGLSGLRSLRKHGLGVRKEVDQMIPPKLLFHSYQILELRIL